MIVVSDASPLITLGNIGCLEVIPSLFGSVCIPSMFERELVAKGPDAGVADIMTSARAWISVLDPANLIDLPGLDAGETAAISLAFEQKAYSLLIDEKNGRKIAVKLGVRVMGTVGVLVEAAKKGLIDLDEMFFRLKTTTFHYPDAELDKLLADFHKRRNDNG
jgi:predicted nucleic acid-binding protein